MRTKSLKLFAVVLILTAGAQAQELPEAVQVPSAALPTVALPTVTLPPELDRVLRDYERAWMQKQPSALAALFTAQGMALHNGSPPARGAAQIAARYAETAGSPLSLRPLAYSVSHDMAYIVGGFASAAGESDSGKFVLVLRRGGDGDWKIAADIDNMNALPAAPMPEPAQADGPVSVPDPAQSHGPVSVPEP
jgi:ketosteroid isomerase-like protein